MVASSHSGTQTPIQQILRTTAQHFAIAPQPQLRQSTLAMYASEFKDPLPLRWRQTSRQIVRRQFHAADLVTLRSALQAWPAVLDGEHAGGICSRLLPPTYVKRS